MANLKINELPLFTGNTSGSYLILNDNTETTTYKVSKEKFNEGLISGSSQLTSSLDGRYIKNTSNSFNGTQTMTGSLVVSGSVNLIVDNLSIGTSKGDEGGEMLLVKSETNTTLTGSGVTLDVYRDKIRIFEQGGNARGVSIDLSKTPNGVGGELTWKVSGLVNAGTFLTLDNIKATVTSSGQRGLSLATVSGTVSGYISGHYEMMSGTPSGGASTTTLSTTATASIFSWNFGAQGDTSTYILKDDTNGRVYRITLMIGGSYINNFISIERIY